MNKSANGLKIDEKYANIFVLIICTTALFEEVLLIWSIS